eukprot:1159053-Pelagomonas_calceolata.AAC.1
MAIHLHLLKPGMGDEPSLVILAQAVLQTLTAGKEAPETEILHLNNTEALLVILMSLPVPN